MASRPRERRTKRTQYTGVLRPDKASRTSLEHSETRQSNLQWRLLSLIIVLSLSAILLLMVMSDVFYVRSIAVGGLNYLTKEEIFAYTDVANMHIFWIDADEVRENLLQSPAVADAEVSLGWPPQMVNVLIEERQPALVWEQGGTAIWVDVQGYIMAQRQDLPNLMRISAEIPVEEGPLGGSRQVDEAVVVGALQLQELLPDVAVLRYDAVRGLGYRNANGWDIWFGVGNGMREKMSIYKEILENLTARGIQAGEINVVNPDAPYYTVLFGR
jgi:cell division septal protein FtsQ